MKRSPFISVVVCCYNGGDVLPACLSALRNQKWSGKYEVIVVDDNSSDNTSEVAVSFGARVIRNSENLGPAGARNAGIKAARGSIVAFTDDDCRPRPSWLNELAKHYKTRETVAVGGKTLPHSQKSLLYRYISRNNPLAPLELGVLKKRSALTRAKDYAKGVLGLGAKKKKVDRSRSVYAMPSANLSVRKSVLEEVGMFDESYGFSGEDQDLCRRINTLYPGGVVYSPKAIVLHEFENSLRDTLRRSLAYGKGNAAFQQKYPEVSAVIFPYPLLVGLLSLVAASTGSMSMALASFVVIPLLYARWARLALGNMSYEPLVYSYIQFAQESYGDIGFLQGKLGRAGACNPFKVGRPSGSDSRIGGTTKWPLLAAAMFILLFNVLQLTGTPLRVVVSLVAMLILPGHLIVAALKPRVRKELAFMLALPISAASVMLIGLLSHAFVAFSPSLSSVSRWNYVAGLDILLIVLTLWAYAKDQTLGLPRRIKNVVSIKGVVAFLALSALPVAGIFGANLLNNVNNNAVSMLTLISAVGAGFVLLIRARMVSPRMASYALYSIGLTILLLGSMRGAIVGGIDISKEYFFLQTMQSAGHWSPSLIHDAYNACLSINIFPDFISKLVGSSNSTIFRFYIPLIYAVVPVIICETVRAWRRGAVAIAAGLFVIAQPAFVAWSPVPIRQMLGILFFTALVAIILNSTISRKHRQVLVLAFGIAMILSHYSTTYIALAVVAVAFLVRFVASLFAKRSIALSLRRKQPVSLPVVMALVAIAILWYGPVTHTSGNITSRFIKASKAVINGDFGTNDPNAYADKTSLAYQFSLRSDDRSRQEVLNDYLDYVDSKYASSNISMLKPRDATDKTVTLLNTEKNPSRNSILSAGIGVLDNVVRKIVKGLLVIGLVAIIWSILKRRRIGSREIYGITGGLLLALIIVIPHASIDYDVGRTTQQLLAVLIVPVILGARIVAKMMRKITLKTGDGALLGVISITLLLFTTGLLPQLTGGSEPGYILNNSGSQYDQIYVHSGEIMGAKWLKGNQYDNARVYSGYFSGTRFHDVGLQRPTVYNDILPWAIDKNAYIFSGYAETVDKRASTYRNGSYISYEYPSETLNELKSVIYSNGSTEVYK